MANQFTVGSKSSKPDKNDAGLVLTPKQQRFFVNLATERFPTLKACAIDAGYAVSSAGTVCVTMAKEYADYIEGLRLRLWTDETMEEAKRTTRLAKKILRDLALSSANDQVKRLACRDILELAGELKANKADKPEDLTPRDLRLAAQGVAQGLMSQPVPANAVN